MIPPELRNLIYEQRFSGQTPLTHSEPNITFACNQARIESLPLLYTRTLEVYIEDGNTETIVDALPKRNPILLNRINRLGIVVNSEEIGKMSQPTMDILKPLCAPLAKAGFMG